jgi:hypothetical protein
VAIEKPKGCTSSGIDQILADLIQAVGRAMHSEFCMVFLISNFCCVLNVVCFLLGNCPASVFYMSMFQNSLFHLHRQVGVKNELGWRNGGIFLWEKVWLQAKPFPI